MSPMFDLQRQFRELGRIRLGEQRTIRGKTVPVKLDTFRLTSPTREYLERAADIYHGTVEPWAGQDRDKWQLTTEVDKLDIIVPRGSTLSQWHEMWGGGGCLRRCDSRRELIGDTPCLCPPDPADRNALAAKGEACKPTTRLSVALPSLPDIGTWMLVSHSYYAAVELAGTYDLLAAASDQGRTIPAILGIDNRSTKRQGQPRHDFPVPIIILPDTLNELMSGPSRPQIAAPVRLALPAPAELPEVATIVPVVKRATPVDAECGVTLGTEECWLDAGHEGPHKSVDAVWPQGEAETAPLFDDVVTA